MDLHDLIIRELDEIKTEMREMRAEVRSIVQFKWQIIGGSVVLSVLITIALQVMNKP